MKESFGKRLIELRKKKAWTQEELAKKLNVSAQAVSKWEKDVSLPDVGLLSTIASTFDTSIDYLLGHQATGPVVGVSTTAQKKDLNRLVFKIKVRSNDGDKVNVNLAWPLVKGALDMGIILIKEQNKTKLSLWLPSGPIVLRTFLKYLTYDGKKMDATQRKLLVKQIQLLRKIHKPLVLIDIESKTGDKVYIKI